MDFKLIWTNRALSDLAAIIRYYREEEKSTEAALKVGSAIVEPVEVLRTFPAETPKAPTPTAGTSAAAEQPRVPASGVSSHL
jgi:plasmid stabilization system protein ParE